MIRIYSKSISPRLSYVTEFIFKFVLDTQYEIVTQDSESLDSDLLLNYSDETIKADLNIKPISLLFENDIKSVEIEIKKWNGLPSFFHSSEELVPFDLFAATFYLISRYEEYLPYTADEFKRFPHTKSLAFQEGFLHTPLVDKWLHTFKKILVSLNPNLKFQVKPFSFIPTYDIDIAYSYHGKGLKRNAGGLFRDLLKGKISHVTERLMVLLKQHKDPFDAYDYLDKLHHDYSLEPIYFILLGDGKDLDKNIKPSSSIMQNLISLLSSKYSIGLHPSFKSNESLNRLRNEIEMLNYPILSRQHYIRFNLPDTFRNLIDVGIKHEYSMGYGSINGFRASTSYAYLWFDVIENKKHHLWVHPFCYMECNSRFEQKQTPNESLNEMLHYLNEVKAVNGNFISIWHNFSLGTDADWKPWKEIYTPFIKQVQSS